MKRVERNSRVEFLFRAFSRISRAKTLIAYFAGNTSLILRARYGKLKHHRMTPQESLSTKDERDAGGRRVCPVCSRLTTDEFVPLVGVDDDLRKLIAANAPDNGDTESVCVRCLRLFERAQDQIDDEVRNKIASLKRGVQEGSREWDILYKKYYEEEAQRKGF